MPTGGGEVGLTALVLHWPSPSTVGERARYSFSAEFPTWGAKGAPGMPRPPLSLHLPRRCPGPALCSVDTAVGGQPESLRVGCGWQ